jgi:hypothetical protein
MERVIERVNDDLGFWLFVETRPISEEEQVVLGILVSSLGGV